MTFSPTPVPKTVQLQQLADTTNINFALLEKTIQRLEEKNKDIDEKLSKRWGGLSPYNIIFQGYDSTGGTSITAAVVVIPLDTEDFKDPIYSHDNTTNNSRVTVLSRGVYKVSYSVNTTDAGERGGISVQARTNGTTLINPSKSYNYGRGNDGIDEATCSATFLISLDASDYIELIGAKVDTTGDDPILIANESWITIELKRNT